MKTIYFDMDGTIANLYESKDWLRMLEAGRTKPYREARSMVNMRKLGYRLKKLQTKGFNIGIVSWLSKSGNEEYNERVTATKLKWLKRHLGAVQFDEINIVKYGTPKSEAVRDPYGILFDDEERNRKEWKGWAFPENSIMTILENLI